MFLSLLLPWKEDPNAPLYVGFSLWVPEQSVTPNCKAVKVWTDFCPNLLFKVDVSIRIVRVWRVCIHCRLFPRFINYPFVSVLPFPPLLLTLTKNAIRVGNVASSSVIIETELIVLSHRKLFLYHSLPLSPCINLSNVYWCCTLWWSTS